MTQSPNGISIEAALDEATRELQVRTRCFPRWVTEGKLSRTDATDRLARQEAAVYFLGNMLEELNKKEGLKESA